LSLFPNAITGIILNLNLLEETLRQGRIPTRYSDHGTQYYSADGKSPFAFKKFGHNSFSTQTARTSTIELIEKAIDIHEKSILLDGLAPMYKDFNEGYFHSLKSGHIAAVHLTIPNGECFNMSQVVLEMATWFRRLKNFEPSRMRLVTTAKEIREAKDDGAISVILGSQSAGFLGLDLSSLDFFARLGIRTMQPTYQLRNQFGSGCGEKKDEGLSNLGVQWVERMNELGMVISLSHVGYKTSTDVMETSKDPVVFDHSNPKALCNHIRNITDDQIKTCAEKGGVIGLCPLAMFLSPDKKPAELGVEDYVNHIDYVVNLVGVDHAGIGLDHTEQGFTTPEKIIEDRRLFPGLTSKHIQDIEDQFLKSGRDRLYDYEVYTPWLKSVSETPIITEALLRRGYSEQDVGKILGENFLRVFERVWGG